MNKNNKTKIYILLALCLIVIIGFWLYSLKLNLASLKNDEATKSAGATSLINTIVDIFKAHPLKEPEEKVATPVEELTNKIAEEIKNQTNSTSTDDWQTYKNEELGLEFKYPKENFNLSNEKGNLYIRKNDTSNYPFYVQINKSEYNNLENFLNQFDDPKWKVNEKDKIEKVIVHNNTAIKITSYSIPQAPNFISYHFLIKENHIILNLMYLTNEFNDNEVGEKILSTFKFLK